MEEEKSVTFGDIVRTIWSQKWLALILLVVITVAGTLIMKFAYGPSREYYESTFSINITTNEDGMLVYPDGTLHNFRDLVSLSNLKAVKEVDEALYSFDVGEMRNSGGISISMNKDDAGVTYTLRVKASYFKSSAEAASFISEIAESPVRDIMIWVDGLSSAMEKNFAEKSGNEQKLDYIKNQLNAISGRFSAMKGISSIATEKVKNLTETASALTGELHQHYYEPSQKALENYKNIIKELEKELEVAKAVLNNLKGINVDASSNPDSTIIIDGSQIAVYAEKVASLERQIGNYQAYIDNNPAGGTESEASKAFTVKLEKLLADAQELTKVYESDYYKNTSFVSYEGAPIRVTGGTGLTTALFLSFAAGFVASAVVAYIVGWAFNRKKTAAAKSATSEQVPSLQEMQAQAAATDEEKE